MAINLEIEDVFNITNRGSFVQVRQIDSKVNFHVTDKSFLGGIELAKFLDIPRSIDENGNQRQDIIVLQLKNPEDAEKLVKGTIVEILPGDEILFLEPWYKIRNNDADLVKELQNEISEKHILFGKQLNAIARRQDNDDVLFNVNNYVFVVVHLTWGRKEENPIYPQTKIFDNWLDVYNNCIVPDHILFNS